MSGEMCNDNRFDIIAAAKADLLRNTNINTSKDEMAVLDHILFRMWQVGALTKYEAPQVRPGQFYKHFKGTKYRIVYVAKSAENGELVVVYQNLDDLTIWVRELEEFTDVLDIDKYPDANQIRRFELYEGDIK